MTFASFRTCDTSVPIPFNCFTSRAAVTFSVREAQNLSFAKTGFFDQYRCSIELAGSAQTPTITFASPSEEKFGTWGCCSSPPQRTKPKRFHFAQDPIDGFCSNACSVPSHSRALSPTLDCRWLWNSHESRTHSSCSFPGTVHFFLRLEQQFTMESGYEV